MQVFSQVSRITREMNFLCPTFSRPDSPASGTEDKEKFEGATVLKPRTGAYFDVITVLDFGSLYPSIICASNLDFCTVVMDPEYANVPGVEYTDYTVGDKTHRYATNVPAVLPKMLTSLKQLRKEAKKKMAAAEAAGDTFSASIYNGSQLAYKIAMNRCVCRMLDLG